MDSAELCLQMVRKAFGGNDKKSSFVGSNDT